MRRAIPLVVSAALVACASGPDPRGPEPTEADREVARLLATAREANRRWYTVIDGQRARREQLMDLPAAAGVALVRRQLTGDAERAGLVVAGQDFGEAWTRRYTASHPMRLQAVGSGAAVAQLLDTLDRRSPTWRQSSILLDNQTAGSRSWALDVRLYLVERVAVPPPPSPPPALPPLPDDREKAVRLLRQHILSMGQALDEGRRREGDLDAAWREAVDGGMATGLVLGSVLTMDEASLLTTIRMSPGRLELEGRAPDQASVEALVTRVEGHGGLDHAALTDVHDEPTADQEIEWVFRLDANVRPGVGGLAPRRR